MKKRNKHRRKLIFLAFPVWLVVKAIQGIRKAMRTGEERLLSARRDLPANAPYHRQRRVVQVGAGIPLTATVFVPTGEGPFPAIIMVHSWMYWRMQCDFLYAPSFARRGYVVLTYDCRGWGSSGGEVAVAAPDGEMRDLEDMITWLTSPEAGLPVDPDKIGITGVSYGGGHSVLIAARDPRIKAAAPMNCWTDLGQALVPNYCLKIAWSMSLLVAGLWAIKFNLKSDLVRWLKSAVKGDLDGVLEEAGERSAINQVENVKCPMFFVHSWNDDLFEPNQVLQFYEKLDAPKKLCITNGLHGIDAGRGDFLKPNAIWDDTRRWFDYWLKGDHENGIDREPNVKYYQPWDRRMVTAEQWPPENVSNRVFYLRGQHPDAINQGELLDEPSDNSEPSDLLVNNTISNLQSSGLPMARLNALHNLPIPGVPFTIPGDSVSFTTSQFEQETIIVGAPVIELYVSSSTEECQINALLYDESRRGFSRLVTHFVSMIKDMKPGVVRQMSFELIACAYRFPAGHKARLVLCASDPLFVLPSRKPSLYRVFHTAEYQSSLSLPITSE